jgi:Starch/carbohydrate-binding module (family 53)/Glycosyl hydrolase family 57
MKFPHRSALAALLFSTLAPGALSAANTSVHTTWLWHLHQPIYWPDRAPANHTADHYQNAWDTIQLGNPHPTDTSVSTVFSVGDRLAAYQGGPSSTVNGLRGYANAGVQLNMSGALMENVQSLAAVGQLGYGSGWNNGNSTARTWTTSGGKPRMDIVNFTYHHALAPLVSDETLEMELRIQQRQMQIFWGTGVPLSRGYFPTETCFSEHMIPVLNKLGIAWTVIGNTHLARTCPDMPIATGSGGEMCDLPNAADQINPAQGAGSYRRMAIDRGCSPIQTAPFGFQLHYARYVNPNSGAESKIILAPSDQVFGWKDSYSTWDLGLIDFIAGKNDPSKPSLVFCAHDGDNAWSGGSSYYNEWVGNMASQASAKGYEPTTIEQFISDWTPSANDVVHVEDGGWVFADSDFGSPSFINWNWPPSYATSGGNVVDPSIGNTDKGDTWRVIIATENRVKTAQQISGVQPNIDQIRDPGSFSTTPNAVELGWHYYLGSLDSGFVYYGCVADECLRAIVAQSNAVRNVNSLISNLSNDTTPPTVFIPQRHPWNPGGTNFGVQYGYKTVVAANTDFWIWTYAYDASGITNVTLFVRNNGSIPPTNDVFKTYAGGSPAGAWLATNMTQRIATNSSGYSPQYMADYYYSKVIGITNAFVDYYVGATDAHGNTYKSPIQHVYVGAGGGGGGGNNGSSGPVSITPTNPVAGGQVTVQYVATGRALSAANQINLHLGFNNYSIIVSPDVPMTYNAASNWWQCIVNITNVATTLNCTFNNGAGAWDNNGGANWNFTVTSNSTPSAPFAPTGLTTTVANASQINLSWVASSGATGYIILRGGVPVASNSVTSYSDTGLALNSTYCYSVVATNSIGNSSTNTAQCVTIQIPATPASLSATAVSTNQINLSWSASSGAIGYLVTRDSSTLATTANTNYSDTTLTANSNHCYTITATNNVGSSTPTASQCATTLTNNPTLCGGRTCVSPAPLVQGNPVTISYTAIGGPISAAATIYLHLGWNNWGTLVSPDLAMTYNAGLGVWQFTTNIPANAAQLDCVFNNGSGTWDNNSSADWHFVVATNGIPQPPGTPTGLSASAISTSQINLNWTAVGNATAYFVTRDSSVIAATSLANYSDSGLAANSSHCYSVVASNNVSVSSTSATICTNSLALTTNLPPFLLDGSFDSSGYQLASSGMVLYGAVRGTTLYVATWSPGTNGPNDHFIFVSDQLLPSATAAPAAAWNKSGLISVSTNKPFLAGESINNYVSWYANGVATNWQCAKASVNSGAMEGTLDLVAAFGSMPTNLYLCATAYTTTNGGFLASQCPAAVTANNNIEPNEFFVLPLGALKDSLGNGTLDLCDPARGFKILSTTAQNTNRIFNFAVMPGRNYQLFYANNVTGPWTNFPGTNFATPPGTSLNFTDAPAPGTPQRFYRVKLLP